MSVGDALVKAGCARRESALFGAVRYLPSHEAVDRVVNKLRAELLEEGVITEEAALLAVLLDKSNQMKMFFSKYEQGEISQRRKALAATEAGRKTQDMIDHIYAMLTITTVLSTQ
ncbi:GPP34 family phosphoprotein [Ruthenibacterium sp.]|uniref:GPP34 family phosphoprotein n=1 Tax=Ruthenibacterium sp. TaxID=1905345 RepID=UPI00257E62EA|nr:GPP34 family phosphoprotein [Ruthenibacterium sp.]MBQ1358936.1 GPP34 family phosphoprotein [Ruthenibacterium sp.]